VILHEAEPVHVEAERGLDARDVKHRAWEPVGHGVDATTPPACAETAGDTWHHRDYCGLSHSRSCGGRG
jgi:hypothetical protein